MKIDRDKMNVNISYTEVDKNISMVKSILGDTKRYAHVITFGCQQNEADSEKIRGMAVDMGYKITDNAECADLIVVNTCAIREHAELKALSLLGRFKAIKKTNPALIVGVVGCMVAQSHIADMLKKDFHYVSFTIDPGNIHKMPELILKSVSEHKRSFVFGGATPDIVEGVNQVRASTHRAWVSIMYGCNNFCSYCIVPYVRGRERSRASSDVINECK